MDKEANYETNLFLRGQMLIDVLDGAPTTHLYMSLLLCVIAGGKFSVNIYLYICPYPTVDHLNHYKLVA